MDLLTLESVGTKDLQKAWNPQQGLTYQKISMPAPRNLIIVYTRISYWTLFWASWIQSKA